jgi:hypothetical protein
LESHFGQQADWQPIAIPLQYWILCALNRPVGVNLPLKKSTCQFGFEVGD